MLNNVTKFGFVVYRNIFWKAEDFDRISMQILCKGDKAVGVLRAVGKSMLWNALYIVVGLFQLFIVYYMMRLINKPFEMDKILLDGVILFFCSAFVTGSIIEYYFCDVKCPRWLEGFFIGVFAIVLGFVVATYCIVTLSTVADINILAFGTWACFVISIGYSLLFHTIMFLLKEGNK